MEARDIILGPVVSEKSTIGVQNRKYSFKVDKKAGKIDIRGAVEKIFEVKVEKVNTLNLRGRVRRRGKVVGFTPAWKKAIVTLKKGGKGIEFFDNIT
ncbi:MAG: 50S ribosomal protein L23 [Oscillospiraceae bacterium]|jgi:large subunit ribosomal protein L23|nr:50S ribosomal protein L23 [Oscillospiraceae bacterium]